MVTCVAMARSSSQGLPAVSQKRTATERGISLGEEGGVHHPGWHPPQFFLPEAL